MNKQKLTKLALLVIVSLSFLLSACKPEGIILNTSKVERDIATYMQDTCNKRADGTCKTMGE